METPLISQIDRNTLITFPSALEDFELNSMSDKSKDVFFSNYVLLNIPDITLSSNKSNVVDVLRNESVGITGINNGVGSVGDRLDISESLQNYMLNAECLLTEAPHYDKSTLLNSSETIFWKWLNEVGGIRYRNADSNESMISTSFVEENPNSDPSKPLYNRVVVQVGNIGMQNTMKGRKNSFREVYVLIPTDSGSTPNILFKSVSDINYYPYLIWQKDSDKETINGYASESYTPPTGLDINAHYDNDVNGLEYTTTDKAGDVTETSWKDYNLTPNTYCTEKEFGVADNETLIRYYQDGSNKEIYRSKLDGVRIDFDFKNYVAYTPNIQSFDSYNKNIRARSFQYNAMLIYYTIKNTVTGESAVNLYGLAILGDVEEYSAGTSRIIRINKIKNDTNTSTTGNSFGYKFNFKLSARQDSITPEVEVEISPENNFNMSMFSSLMATTQEIIKNYETTMENNRKILEINDSLMLQLSNSNTNDINKKYDELLILLQENNINDPNGKMLEEIQTKIYDILAGKTSVSVDVMMEVVGKGGIIASYDKIDGLLTISNSQKNYSEVEKLVLDTSPNNINTAKIGTSNKLIIAMSDLTLDSKLVLRLDDSVNWDSGQSVEVMGHQSIVGNTLLEIYTDSGNKVSGSSYGMLIYSNNFEAGKSIKITCIDKKNMEFLIA